MGAPTTRSCATDRRAARCSPRSIAFGATPADALAIDLGCGDGRDVVEILRRGWRVVAVDAEPEALRQLAGAAAAAGSDHADRGALRGRAAADRRRSW